MDFKKDMVVSNPIVNRTLSGGHLALIVEIEEYIKLLLKFKENLKDFSAFLKY